MKRLALAVALLIAGVAAALAQSNVQVIGPITPGNVPQFSSPTVIKDSGVAGGTGAFANPTAAVGLTAVNGSALTAMRSDAAPPLSASVQSALTGTLNQLLIGTGAFGFTAIALGGDCTFTSPNITCTKTNGTAFGAIATLGIGTGLASGGGNLNCSVFGAATTGCVPGSGGGTANFLRADGTWQPAGVNGLAITPSQINSTCYVDGTTFTTLASALATCSSNATVIVPSNQTISTIITVAGNNVKIVCENGITLTVNTSQGIRFNGAGDGVERCVFNGPGTGVTTVPPVIFNNQNGFARWNEFTNFGSTSLSGILLFGTSGNVSGARVEGNYIHNNNDIGLDFVTTGVMRNIRIINNYIGNGVFMIPQTGATPSDIVITGNNLDAGSGGFTNPVGTGVGCAQILGGNATIFDVAFTGNSCHLEASIVSAGSECIGLAGVQRFAVTGNTCDTRGFTAPLSFEFNQMTDGTISGNYSNNTSNSGFLSENLRFVSFIGNVQDGFATSSGSFAFEFTTNTASAIQQGLTISGNVAVFPNAGTGTGIRIICAGASAICGDYTIQNNVINSDGTAGSTGIWLNRTAGTWPNNLVGPNLIRATAVGVKIDASITANCYLPGLNLAPTALSNSGSASSCL
jgi:hypothetical protein